MTNLLTCSENMTVSFLAALELIRQKFTNRKRVSRKWRSLLCDVCFVFLCNFCSKHFPHRQLLTNYTRDAYRKSGPLRANIPLMLSHFNENCNIWTKFGKTSQYQAYMGRGTGFCVKGRLCEIWYKSLSISCRLIFYNQLIRIEMKISQTPLSR
jgi:hypothetical protein